MSISTPRVKPVPGGPVRVATAVLVAVLALVLAGTTEAASPDTTTEAKLSREQAQHLRKVANKWASLFAVKACNHYMGQGLCMRLDCARCVAAYQRTFAGATVEDIALKGFKLIGPPRFTFYSAAVRFSNGEVVMFAGLQACGGKNQPEHCQEPGVGGVSIGEDKLEWLISLPNRRFLRAANTPP
jgi:hypothetical protein